MQIPPSPATLTKQLQNAYMTEAALSPSVSQSQHSGSSYSSPGTTHDLPFTEPPPASDDSFSAVLVQPGSSSSAQAPGLSVTNVSPENDAQMGALSSPSGDVYLHQSSTSLGLESLEAGALPLVVGMEVRTHSPALSDLVSSGPLLPWSPRSADSMMAQSPSLNDALTANIPLDVNNSEDSLCDSSTGFPGLFSIEGDGVSVSSSTSEDMRSASPGGGNGSNNQQQHLQQQEQEMQDQKEVTIDLNPIESEQDHTITSTRSPTQLELPVASLGSSTPQSSNSIMVNQATQDTPWRFDNSVGSKSVINNSTAPISGHQNSEKLVVKEETDKSSCDNGQGSVKSTVQVSQSKVKQNTESAAVKEEPDEPDDVKIVAEVVAEKSNNRERRSAGRSSKSERMVDTSAKHTTSEEGNNRKRSQRLACPPERKKSNLPKENEVSNEELPTKNGHDDSNQLDLKMEDTSSNVGKNKRRSSNRATAASPSILQGSTGRSRSKSIKTETEVKEECDDVVNDIDIKEEEIKDEKMFVKVDKELKESGETVGRNTRGAKRRSEGDNLSELKRGRSNRSCRRSDGFVLSMEEEVLNHLEEDSAISRGLRGRHISGTSDTSSNYSMERTVTPGPHDSPGISGNRRRRRHSRESSVSSRDGSPPSMHTHDFSPGGVNTRRSSTRDHAKKKKCSCCTGGEQKKNVTASGRRSSVRSARGPHGNASLQ